MKKKIIIHKIKMLTLLMPFFAAMFCSFPAQAVEHGENPGAHHEKSIGHGVTGYETATNTGGHRQASDTHKETRHRDGHSGQAPLSYYIYWLLLTVSFTISCFYCLWIYKKGKPAHEGLWLAAILVIFGIALYTIDQFPELKRHFDRISNRFVDGYHEPTGLSIIKLLYKAGLGVLLMIYGLMGRREH